MEIESLSLLNKDMLTGFFGLMLTALTIISIFIISFETSEIGDDKA